MKQEMELHVQTQTIYQDSWGEIKRLRIITVNNIEQTFQSLLKARRMIRETLDELFTHHVWREYDCTGQYSTRKFELVYRDWSHYDNGQLQYIYVEHGGLDI